MDITPSPGSISFSLSNIDSVSFPDFPSSSSPMPPSSASSVVCDSVSISLSLAVSSCSVLALALTNFGMMSSPLIFLVGFAEYQQLNLRAQCCYFLQSGLMISCRDESLH